MNLITAKHTDYLKHKFNKLADSFLSEDKICNDHIELKREHTFSVCDEITLLAVQMGLSQEKITLANVIALLHDIGRFEQFYTYRTFDDSRSLNHAELSVRIIQSDGFLEAIPSDYQDLVFKSILNHNLPSPDFSMDDEITFFSKLLRDADKLDIWRVITNDELRNIIEKKDDNEDYEIPEPIFQKYNQRKFVTHNQAATDNDIRLLRISWIFDINFKQTFKEIKKRKLMDKIFRLVPESARKKEIEAIVYGYIEEKIG